MVDICYVISHGFAARMILQSEIIPELKKTGASIAVVAPNAEEAPMQAMAETHGIQMFKSPEKTSRLLGEYEWYIRRFLFEDIQANPALRSWLLRFKDRPDGRKWTFRVKAGVCSFLNKWSMRSPRFMRLLDRLEERVFLDQDEYAQLIARIDPTMVVSTYPVDMIEACLLYAADKSGRTTVSQLLSWDNITSKGRFSVNTDYYLTWGPIMSEEVEEYYGIPQERLFECGVAHFDRHITMPETSLLHEGLEARGLDPARPYLFFGMSSPAISPHEIEVVEWLAAKLNEGEWGSDIQLVVRPHPQNIEGSSADPGWLPRLKALRGPRIAVDFPSLEKSTLAWSMKQQDLPWLVNLISGCSILLNSGSTLSVEGIIHDKPGILTLFDAGHDLPWGRSIRRYFDFIHSRKLIEMGGVWAVKSFEELTEAIATYLSNPDHHASGRALSRERQTGPTDGKASLRVAQSLAEILNRTERSTHANAASTAEPTTNE